MFPSKLVNVSEVLCWYLSAVMYPLSLCYCRLNSHIYYLYAKFLVSLIILYYFSCDSPKAMFSSELKPSSQELVNTEKSLGHLIYFMRCTCICLPTILNNSELRKVTRWENCHFCLWLCNCCDISSDFNLIFDKYVCIWTLQLNVCFNSIYFQVTSIRKS